jgi:hypothetical protein
MAKRRKQKLIKTNSLEKYQSNLMGAAKGTIGLGIVSGAGMGAMGALGNLAPGSGGVTNAVGGALNLANIGNLASVGMQVANFPKNNVIRRKKKTDVVDSALRKILY